MTPADPSLLHQPHGDDDCRRSAEAFDAWRDAAAREVWEALKNQARASAERLWRATDAMRRPVTSVLPDNPDLLPVYRAATRLVVPREVLADRSGVQRGLVTGIETNPDSLTHMRSAALAPLAETIEPFLDESMLPWVAEGRDPTDAEREAFLAVVTDRLARQGADSVLRNRQEQRQIKVVTDILRAKGYAPAESSDDLPPGTYAIRANVKAGTGATNVPVDLLVRPADGAPVVFVELKSAGDETNTNKRRKEESERAAKLRHTFGADTRYVLVLGGRFNAKFLAHMRDSGIEWIWEHDPHAGIDAIFPDVPTG